ncbi:hypothetical protein [Magnetospirillum sp. 15-1]|uniref:hypothetical protein n=1 Tax=Magnetospirillum sp. 15-1 TaxID=1979370 RepID=UPI001144BD6A|nr:hypothetical protein [Magnetospirillum sp. 15-1]
MVLCPDLVGQIIDDSYRLDVLLAESAIGGVFTSRPVIGGQIVAACLVKKYQQRPSAETVVAQLSKSPSE